MIAERLQHFLDAHQVSYAVHPHEARFTAAETAKVARVKGGHFAKSVLLRARDRPPGHYLLAVLPAHEAVDLERLHRLIGFPVELAAEHELRRVFPGFELGAAPPIGELAVTHLPLFVDACLTRGDTIAFCGGTHTDVVEIPQQDYARVTSMHVYECGRAGPGPGPGRSR